MKKTSIFEKFTMLIGHVTLEKMFNFIKSGYYRPMILRLRQIRKEGNRADYDKAKRSLPAFTPSGTFEGGRRLEFLVEYSAVMVMDFDDLTDDDLPEVKALIMGSMYTLACFVSPSGNGLKVLVNVSTGVEEHLHTFLCLQQYYMTLTNVEIDPSGKDVTRLCFVSDDPELYYNPQASVFVPVDRGSGKKGDPKGSPLPNQPDEGGDGETDWGDNGAAGKGETDEQPQTPPAPPKPLSELDLKKIGKSYLRCIEYVGRYHGFVDGHRNVYVYTLALRMGKSGINEDVTTRLLLRDFNYNETEVRNCVKSAFNRILKDSLQSSISEENIPDQPPVVPVPPDAQHPPVVPAPPDFQHPPVVPSPPGSRHPSGNDRNRIRNFPDPLSDESFDQINDGMETTAPPSMQGSKTGREQYDLIRVEKLLKCWYETRYNVVRGVIEWRHANTSAPFIRLEDKHENTMFRKLYHANQNIPIGILHILLYSDFSRDFDPFKDYFTGLQEWDGTIDYIGMLCKTVETLDDAYWEFCLRKWFVAFAMSLLIDEVFNHTVIVFVGVQGVGKTSWMKLLLPKVLKSYFGTVAMQPDSKDTAIQLAECALIIMDELENLNKKDLASFKELITRPEIHLRKPYGRNPENMKHRASFIGSVNVEQVLTDPTGSRRYLCSKVKTIDYQHTVDIDGCMAQAYALYKSGFKFWFDQNEIRELNLRNEDFMSKSVEEELIETWLRPVTREEWDTRNQFASGRNIQLMTATQVATKLMEKAKIILMDNTLVKIGKVMSKLGFVRIRKTNNYLYLVRLVEADVVELSNRTLEDTEDHKSEQDEDAQIIRHKEDLSGSRNPDRSGETGNDISGNEENDELPF